MLRERRPLRHGPGAQDALDGYHLWQPFTQMQTFLADERLVVQRGEGPYLFDAGGKRYLNLTSCLWNVPLGLGQREIIDAIAGQLQVLAYSSLFRAGHAPAVELARLVAAVAPGELNRVFFTSNGSESVEMLIKIARAYFRRKGEHKHKVLSLRCAYHGVSYGALSASGFDDMKADFGPLPGGFRQIEPPYCYRCPFGLEYPQCKVQCACALEDAILEEDPDEVAMFLAEPVMGFGGVLVPPPEYFDVVAAICREYGVLLAVDEVTTGFGRTGRMFAVEHWQVRPDMMALGKAMSNGYFPLGAAVVTDEIWRQFLGPDSSTRLEDGSTNSGHPGACAAGRATIGMLLRDGHVERAAALGEFFLNRLRGLEDLPIVGQVRGLGMMLAVEFVLDRRTKQAPDPAWMARLVKACYAHGLWVHLSLNRILLLPPFILDEETLDEACRGLRKVITLAANWL